MSAPVPAGGVLLRLDRLTLARGGREVVSALSGNFERGTLTAVTGPNGAGKSTLVEALATVGLLGCAQRPISDLSVGQFQRVLFARLLLQDADLILLDEPFNAVDEATTADLLALMRDWRDQGRAVVAVLHDQVQVQAHFDRMLQLDGRRRWAWGATAELLGACAA